MALSKVHRRAQLALGLLLVLLLGAVPATAATTSIRRSPFAHASRVERTIVRCTNHARLTRGLPALRRNPVLRHAASYHARNMLRYNFFDHHDVFGQSPVDRVARFARRGAFRWIGENIAVGTWSAADACRAWMASQEHRANILSRRFTMIGVGFARGAGGRTYYVENFGSRGR